MAPIRRVVVDLLKPHEPRIVEFAREIADSDGVEAVNATLIEIDEKVQNLKLTLEGSDIDFDRLEKEITDLGGSVHSIDEIVCGERVVEESKTPQD
jgi:hypothetical protein